MELQLQLQTVFVEELGIPAERVNDELRYGETLEWDSIAHMALVAAIEVSFDIMIEAEDVIDMSSFAAAKRIVTKYRQG